MSELSEARFTAPREDCPRPEFWTSPDSESSESEVTYFIHALVRLLQPEYVIETGSAHGFTSEALGLALHYIGHGRCVSLEVVPHLVAEARQRVEGLPVEVREQGSLDFEPEQHIDFAFFDSLFHLRPQEFKRYRPWMSERTIVAFHDTGKHYEVQGHIRQLEAEGLLKPVFFPTPRGLCVAQVAPLGRAV